MEGLAGGEVEGVADVGAAAVAGGGELPGADAGLEAGGDSGAAHFVGGDLDGADVAGAKDAPARGDFAFEGGVFEEFFVVALGNFGFLLVDDAFDDLFVKAGGLDIAAGEGGLGVVVGFSVRVGPVGREPSLPPGVPPGTPSMPPFMLPGPPQLMPKQPASEAVRPPGAPSGLVPSKPWVRDAAPSAPLLPRLAMSVSFCSLLAMPMVRTRSLPVGRLEGLALEGVGVGVFGGAGVGVRVGLGLVVGGFVGFLGDDLVDDGVGVFDAGEFGFGGG